MAAGARDVGTGVQALEDLADGRPLVDEPAIKGAHQRGLFLVHDKVAWHGLLARHVAITVRRTAALVVAIARLLAPWICNRSWSFGSSEIGCCKNTISTPARRNSSRSRTW